MNTNHAEILVPIQDRVREKTERLEADLSRIDSRIHRFPRGLRGIGGHGGCYITPSVVSLGPYHHGSPDLEEMEELKHAAAYYFCTSSGHQVDEVYGKVLSVAEQARGCYHEDAVAHLSLPQFAEMMFLDGCFLLMYIGDDLETSPLLMDNMVLSTGPCMLRDIMLLENQLPWLVIEALLTFKDVDVYSYVASEIREFVCITDIGPAEMASFAENRDYRPPHLLGLARFCLTGSMPKEAMIPVSEDGEFNFNMATLSAVKLSEMGVNLKASNAPWFADMRVDKNSPLFAELTVSPVFLNDVTACWLVNMAALEARTATDYPSDGFLISSYLSLLALLMDKEEDVHQLRGHHIVVSLLSNQDTLAFFKAIARHLRLGYRYFFILDAIEDYKRERRLSILIHRFVYRNWKTIVTLASVASVLAGILKTLYSMENN